MAVGCGGGAPARVETGVGAVAPGVEDGLPGVYVPAVVGDGVRAVAAEAPDPFAPGASPPANARGLEAAVLPQAARTRMARSANAVKNSPAGVRGVWDGRGNGSGMV